jgi:hypothetical protein
MKITSRTFQLLVREQVGWYGCLRKIWKRNQNLDNTSLPPTLTWRMTYDIHATRNKQKDVNDDTLAAYKSDLQAISKEMRRYLLESLEHNSEQLGTWKPGRK